MTRDSAAFIFDVQSPHLERLVTSVESLGYTNEGIYLESEGGDVESFISRLTPEALVICGPINLQSIPSFINKFRVACLSFATDIFIDEAEKSLVKLVANSKRHRLKVIVDTETAKHRLISAGFAEPQVSVVPWSFGLRFTQEIHDRKQAKPVAKPRIIFGRSLAPPEIYQPELFLEFAANLAKFFDSVQLTFMSENLPRGIAEECAKIGNAEVLTIPPLSQLEFGELVAEHDLFLQTNSFDGLSVSMMQAMGVGTLVASTRTAGASESLDDNLSGIVFDPLNLMDAVKRTSLVLKNRDLYAKIVHNAEEKYRKNYSGSIAVERLESTLRSIYF